MLKHDYNDNIKSVTKNIIFLAIVCIEKLARVCTANWKLWKNFWLELTYQCINKIKSLANFKPQFTK